MTDKEIMQMALDALEEAKENVMDWGSYASEYFKTKHGLAQDILAIENISEALRTRLAQPEPEELGEVIPADEEQLKRIAKLIEPEPVAWMHDSHVGFNVPLYTAPPQRECEICGKVAKP